jgi:hypothetical protein
MEHYAGIDVSLELSSVCVVGEIALGLAMLERAKRASHIESASVTLRHHAEGVPLPWREPWARHGCERQRRPELENGQDPERTSRICALAKPTAKSQ